MTASASKQFQRPALGRRPENFCLVLVLFLCFSSSSFAQSPLATVSVDTSQLGAKIPRKFVGFSLEVSTAGQGITAYKNSPGSSAATAETQYALGHPGAPNEGYFEFMSNLGPGVLRLGGNSQDNTCWNPSAAPHPDWCKAALDASDFRLFSQAAEASGWKLILGLNLKQNSPPWALSEITGAIAENIPRSEIDGFEIGNEPSLFPRDGSRPKTYSPADRVQDYLGYVHAFEQNPVARTYSFMGPSACCGWLNPQNLGAFIEGVGRDNVKLATVHLYAKTTCNGRTVTIPELLAPELMAHFSEEADSWVEAARQRQVPIALAETNSASCGGMPGVSNAFASAAWGLDWLFTAAEAGFTEVNFHSSYRPGGSSYNPVDTVSWQDTFHSWHYQNTANPLYYAMYMFAQNASGEHLLSTVIQTSANVRAYAVSDCGACAVNVFLINKDASASGRVSVAVPGRTRPASLLLLSAPKLSSLANDISYGGDQFDTMGYMFPSATTKVQSKPNSHYEFELPNAAVALLTVPPEKKQ